LITQKEIAIKQQLFATSQNLTIVEKKHAILDVNTDEALSKLEAKLQTKIAQVEIVGHAGTNHQTWDQCDRKDKNCWTTIPSFKKENKMIKLEKLFQTLNTTEVGLNIAKQQLSETFQYFTSTIKYMKLALVTC